MAQLEILEGSRCDVGGVLRKAWRIISCSRLFATTLIHHGVTCGQYRPSEQ